MEATNSEIARRREIAVIEANILELKWLAAATRFEIALHDRALKYGFNPSVRLSRLAHGLLNIHLLSRPTTTRQNLWKNYSKPFQPPRLVTISIITSSKRRPGLTVIQEK